jgi:dephospho-CoA kinase
MLSIGLTGGIGAGKSLVAQVLEKMGYAVFYSDQEAKALYNEHPELKTQLRALVGEEVYHNGLFQKDVLSKALYNNVALKTQIEALVHPLVRSRFEHWENQQKSQFVFNEAAILFETGAYKQFAATVLVVAPLKVRIERVKNRDGLNQKEIEQRIAAQWPDEQKMLHTPYVLQNDGQPLLVQVEELMEKLQKLAAN